MTDVKRLLKELYQDEGQLGWQERALCAEVDPDLWFPERGSNTAGRAKALCLTCPVQLDCLAYALSLDENPHGVWGGTVERERAMLRVTPYREPAENEAVA